MTSNVRVDRGARGLPDARIPDNKTPEMLDDAGELKQSSILPLQTWPLSPPSISISRRPWRRRVQAVPETGMGTGVELNRLEGVAAMEVGS